MPIKGIILFSVLLLSLPACFIWPFYGILLWSVIAYLVPQSSLLYWSPAANFPWAMVLAIPTLAGLVLFIRNWTRLLAAREVYLILSLWIWFTITSFVSSHTSLFVHHAPSTWYQWRFVSKILLMTLATVAIVNSFERLRILITVIAGCFGYFVLKSIPFILMTGGRFRIYGPENSMIADNNDFGLALNMSLPLFFLLAKTERRRWTRWFWGLLFVISSPVILFTYSRGAMVGLAAVLLLMLLQLQLKQKLLLVPALGLAVAMGFMFAPESWRQRMDPTSEELLDASAQERLKAWAYARELAADFPVTGGGFQTYTPELFARYAPQGSGLLGPHSIYFQILAEHGYVGLMLYLGLLLSCMATLRRVAKVGQESEDWTIVQYAKIMRFSFVGFMVSGLFLGRAYFDYFFSFVACVVILKTVALQRAEQEPDEAEETNDVLAEKEILALNGG